MAKQPNTYTDNININIKDLNQFSDCLNTIVKINIVLFYVIKLCWDVYTLNKTTIISSRWWIKWDIFKRLVK